MIETTFMNICFFQYCDKTPHGFILKIRTLVSSNVKGLVRRKGGGGGGIFFSVRFLFLFLSFSPFILDTSSCWRTYYGSI